MMTEIAVIIMLWKCVRPFTHTPFKHTRSPNSEIPKNLNKTEYRGAGDSDYSGNLLRHPTHGIVDVNDFYRNGEVD